jgi:hypothetical protein
MAFTNGWYAALQALGGAPIVVYLASLSAVSLALRWAGVFASYIISS